MSKKSGIRMVTPVKQITRYSVERIEENQLKFAKMLDNVGLQCVTEARKNGSYNDRSGNLRNSIGYVVLVDGRVYSGDQGSRPETQSLLAEVIPQFRTGIALIVAAGMEYAGYVEARGFNVITSSRLLAQKLVPQMLTQLGFERT
jgi:hypothetical protein